MWGIDLLVPITVVGIGATLLWLTVVGFTHQKR